MRLIILAGVGILVLQRLNNVGWTRILAEMPRSIAFYTLFPIWYIAGPAVDAVLYRHLWCDRWRTLFPIMLRKRVLNESVLGYSGEAYLAVLAGRKYPHLGGALFDIRDANIISSFVSTSVTLAMVAIVFTPFLTTQSEQTLVSHPSFAFAAAGGLLALIVSGAIIGPRFLRLTKTGVRYALCAYLMRIAFVMLLQIALWKTALPTAHLGALLVILTSSQAATRIPFAPSYDVLLLGAGMTVAPALGLPVSEVSGVLVACFALSQVSNLAIWAMTSRNDQRSPP